MKIHICASAPSLNKMESSWMPVLILYRPYQSSLYLVLGLLPGFSGFRIAFLEFCCSLPILGENDIKTEIPFNPISHWYTLILLPETIPFVLGVWTGYSTMGSNCLAYVGDQYLMHSPLGIATGITCFKWIRNIISWPVLKSAEKWVLCDIPTLSDPNFRWVVG